MPYLATTRTISSRLVLSAKIFLSGQPFPPGADGVEHIVAFLVVRARVIAHRGSLGHGVLLIVGLGYRSSEEAVERRLKQMGRMPRIIRAAPVFRAREGAVASLCWVSRSVPPFRLNDPSARCGQLEGATHVHQCLPDRRARQQPVAIRREPSGRPWRWHWREPEQPAPDSRRLDAGLEPPWPFVLCVWSRVLQFKSDWRAGVAFRRPAKMGSFRALNGEAVSGLCVHIERMCAFEGVRLGHRWLSHFERQRPREPLMRSRSRVDWGDP